MFDIFIVWNREFHWCHHSSKDSFDKAKKMAISLSNMGDGAAIKKVKVVNTSTEKVVFTC